MKELFFMTVKDAHMSLSDRQIIETGISNGSSKKSITDSIGKNKSAITKEIKNHWILKKQCNYLTACTLFANNNNKNTFLCSNQYPNYSQIFVIAAIVPRVPEMSVLPKGAAITTNFGTTHLRLTTNTAIISFSAVLGLIPLFKKSWH